MFTDIYTIIRKEWKEIFLQKGGMRGGLLSQVIILALLGVFLPLQNGPEWLTSPAAALAWLWLPVMLTMNMVAEAFAGERERHTLETLLASRLSDRAILFGKMAASILYGFAIAVLTIAHDTAERLVNLQRLPEASLAATERSGPRPGPASAGAAASPGSHSLPDGGRGTRLPRPQGDALLAV